MSILRSMLKSLLGSRLTPDAAAGHASASQSSIEELLRQALVAFSHDAPKPIKVIDYELVAYVMAAAEAGQYMRTHMAGARNYGQRDALLRAAMESCDVAGLTLEFGVFKGASLRFLAGLTPDVVHGFDSFRGLPEDWTHFQKMGRFDLGGEVPVFREPNIRVHPGWFSDTLPPFLAREQAPVRFLHLDCDLYSSTREVLGLLAPRLVSGTVIVFDDYLNYPAWREHQYRAFQEFVAERSIRYRYTGFASSYTAVTVRLD
jgi:hypothetical protein